MYFFECSVYRIVDLSGRLGLRGAANAGVGRKAQVMEYHIAF